MSDELPGNVEKAESQSPAEFLMEHIEIDMKSRGFQSSPSPE